jgi:Smg protein
MKLIEMVGLFLRRGMEAEDWDQAEEEIVESMLFQGYDLGEINMALSVAHRLREQMERQEFSSAAYRSNRMFEHLEQLRLTPEARGYLLRLVHAGTLTPLQREEIVEKTFFVDAPEIGLDEVQYIVQMVLAGEELRDESDDDMKSEWYH